ncbi:MAG: recombinase family protein, partial [Candidatus Dadabacteria bacterium]|nr:recombinase family protein [Candidatus Dadabacteria bacterium]NIQ14621.1 recombinase family protein [Candidatus Dadabacteria bacterium]
HLSEKNGLTIVSILREEKSAKAPGRPIFNQMIDEINSGNANGILCWKLDRLARNPIDGGTINWMLQQGKIKHIQTFQRGYLPEDNTLMMSLEFGMANQFVLDLSVNTKRGMRNKAEQGWLPHKPPIGYLNNKHNLPEHPPIYKNPEMFPLIKKLWDTLLKERCSIDALYEKAIEMGLKTTKQSIIKRSAFYDIFRNPFYYGSFIWNGKLHIGKHEPMISKEDFDLAQMIIDGKVHKIKKNHTFLYTNLIRCADCGASITAERKVKHQKNGNIHKYTYYRCTKQVDLNCKQKAIREEKLEEQIHTILEKIEIPASFHQWAVKYLKQEHEKEKSDRNEIIELYQKSLNRCTSKLD